MLRQPAPWQDWQRRKDYYQEGVMLWLTVDAILRERSGGEKGLDDFARIFFGGASDTAPTRTYDFEALCATLNAVAPQDWAAILGGWIEGREKLDTNAGLAHHGWRLVYAETPSLTFRQNEMEEGVSDLSYSLGLKVREDGIVRSVSWDSPAFKAGLAPRSRILAVHGAPFSPQQLEQAVLAAANKPVRLTVEQDGQRDTRAIPYRGSLRYPKLERIPGTPDTLTALFKPR